VQTLTCSIKRYEASSTASLAVLAPQHQRTEAVLAQHLALALTTASLTLQLTSGVIIIDHACKQTTDTGATGVTVLM